MGRFRRALDDLELRDLPLNGRRFTWSNERENPTLEGLDRVFCSVDWEAGHPNCLLTCVATLISDHCPLLLHTEVTHCQHRRFHFEPFWPQIPGFHETVQAAWAEPAFGNPITVIDHKLRTLGRRLKSWSDKNVGNIRMQIECAKELIYRFDVTQESRPLSPLEGWFRRELKKKFLGLCSLQRTIARQRSRILWLKEGEANTKFFHLHANHRRRKNFISQISHNGDILVDQNLIEDAFANHFEDVFSAPADRDFSLNLDALGLPRFELSHLDAEFSEEEVLAAIKDMPSDRAPGPDGFTGCFFKSCWSVIKEDIMAVFAAVHCGRAHGFSKINKALVTLLPKKLDASEIWDYRPISLVHSVAKLIAKTMSLRLAPILPSMVTPNQSAFIRGRTIQDNFMLVQQLAKSFHSANAPTVLLKLDIARAFDTVSWSFLIELMQHLGFGHIWINLVCLLLSTASTIILVNTNPSAEFFHHRGVRQGDPLSPMLFVLVMQVFHYLVDLSARLGLLAALPGSRGACRTSLYADDTVIFFKPTLSDCDTIKQLI
ncbi:hypothetical protein ACQ4PT_048153 [Festuca glaucescens]